jgi:hypothetical protein
MWIIIFGYLNSWTELYPVFHFRGGGGDLKINNAKLNFNTEADVSTKLSHGLLGCDAM